MLTNPRAGQTTAEGANGETLYARTSNLTYNNEQSNSASKTLATLGHGTIAVGATALEQNSQLTDAGKAADSPSALLNRDTTTTGKELWNSEQSQTVDVTLDHRLLSKDGLNDIKKDAGKVYNTVASYFSDVDPNIKAQTGETGSRAYDALRHQGLSDADANTLLSDPKLVNILNRLDNAESILAQGDSKAPSNTTPATPDAAPSVLRPGEPEEIVVTGRTIQQTATEDAVFALNDLKNYIGKTRETNPKTAAALETGISLATGGAVVTAVGKGIEYGLDKSGMGETVAKQVSKVTDPIVEAGANGIDRYDLSNEEFHEAVVEDGQEGSAASLKGGTGFFIGSVLGVGGGVLGLGKVAGKAGNEPHAGSKTSVNTKEIEAGCKGAWCKELNRPEPNTTYKVDDNYTFHTDAQGRTAKVEGTLNLETADRSGYQQGKAGKSGLENDEGGHLIAAVFSGPGEKINLVPMDGNLNKGEWKKMENEWATALKYNKEVKVTVEPVYAGASNRPTSFNITYQIDSGEITEKTFKNSPSGI